MGMELCEYHLRREDQRRIARAKKDIEKDVYRLRKEVLEECSEIQKHRWKLCRPDPYPLNGWSSVVINQPLEVYKVCAAVGNKLVSVYDGKTEYRLGEWHYAPRGAASWPPLKACMFVFSDPHQAVQAWFPYDAKNPRSKAYHVLLRCRITEPPEVILSLPKDAFSRRPDGRRTSSEIRARQPYDSVRRKVTYQAFETYYTKAPAEGKRRIRTSGRDRAVDLQQQHEQRRGAYIRAARKT